MTADPADPGERARILAIAHELGGLAGVVRMWAHVLATSPDDEQRERAASALRAAAEEQARLVEELVSTVAPGAVKSSS